jgi:SAM-dependent methyltransferase
MLNDSTATRDLSEHDLVRFCSPISPGGAISELLVNEARFGLSRLLPYLPSSGGCDLHVLEVGAGSCLLSAYLASKKLRVSALEPLGSEFDFLTKAQADVLDFCRRNEIALQLMHKGVEQLDISGQFDLVFTINALEHMRDPLLAIDNMYRSLKPGGTLLVHCPNYTVPFDSHFNVVLITRSKSLNTWLYWSRIQRYPEVWHELNFIRYAAIRRHLKRCRLDFEFNRTIARDFVLRLFSDRIFAQRMPALVRAAGATLKRFGMVEKLDLVPARFQSPMEVVVRRGRAELRSKVA